IVQETQESSTPYDDIVRTLLHDSAESIIPVVNHMFGKTYSDKAEITTYTTEHVRKRANGKVVRRNSDLHFAVTEKGQTDEYHYEVQTAPDGSILMRFFEYDTHMAFGRREQVGPLHERYRLPNAGLICLRSYGGRPKEMRYTVVTSETEADHVIPVLSMGDTTVSKLIEGDLFFLLPFFLFCHVKELEKIEKSPERLEELFAEERRIAEFYESLEKKERLKAAELDLFLEMTKRAVQNLALEQPRIKEGTEKLWEDKSYLTQPGKQ
ncbi:MAG: hypothetical protein HDQ87_03455, partial [Clostridia bacterium]|nr:hypothetical protein [Clostridia bacterium]